MDKLNIKYNTHLGALPPQPIRVGTSGWAGLPQKMVDGSEPQPWHCLPFVEGSTYGLELIYPYETECTVVNDGGDVRFDFDFTREPGGILTGGEFITFFPKKNSKFYLFNTRLDLQAPPGYVLRTEPHPRFFTDDTGTVPAALIGHVQSEWYPRKLFVVFKGPRPGERHVFRKGEPFAQVIFVPQRVDYELTKLTPEEEKHRRDLENAIEANKALIATNLWHNPDGSEFNNHYKVMAAAFNRDGAGAVEQVVGEAKEQRRRSLPTDKSIPEVLEIGFQKIREEKYDEAKAIYTYVLGQDPQNAEALSRLGICVGCTGAPQNGLKLMAQAVALQPNVPSYHANLGEMFRLIGRFDEAASSFRSALRLNPSDAALVSVLGLTLAQAGRHAEGLQAVRDAIAMAPRAAVNHYRLGLILAAMRRVPEARAAQEAALALDPAFTPARRALQEMPPAAPPQG